MSLTPVDLRDMRRFWLTRRWLIWIGRSFPWVHMRRREVPPVDTWGGRDDRFVGAIRDDSIEVLAFCPEWHEPKRVRLPASSVRQRRPIQVPVFESDGHFSYYILRHDGETIDGTPVWR